MICAVIDIEAGEVMNLIIADAGDPIPHGYRLIADPPAWVTIGTPWDGDFIRPPEPPSIIEKL